MRKRITLLLAAVMLALTMSFGAAGAFAVNTCKDFTFTPATSPPFGQQEDSCQKGSTETTVTKHGKGDGQGNTDEESVKHTGHGDVIVE